MKTRIVIDTHLEKVAFGNLLFIQAQTEKDEGYFAVSNSDTLQEASEHFGVSQELLVAIDEAIKYGLETLIENINKDLIDIWKLIENKEVK